MLQWVSTSETIGSISGDALGKDGAGGGGGRGAPCVIEMLAWEWKEEKIGKGVGTRKRDGKRAPGQHSY